MNVSLQNTRGLIIIHDYKLSRSKSIQKTLNSNVNANFTPLWSNIKRGNKKSDRVQNTRYIVLAQHAKMSTVNPLYLAFPYI